MAAVDYIFRYFRNFEYEVSLFIGHPELRTKYCISIVRIGLSTETTTRIYKKDIFMNKDDSGMNGFRTYAACMIFERIVDLLIQDECEPFCIKMKKLLRDCGTEIFIENDDIF